MFGKSDILPFMLPAIMYMFGNDDDLLMTIIKTWLKIVLFSSIMFGFIGLNAGHHNTETVHDGDSIR